MKSKQAGYILVIASLYYIAGEATAAVCFNSTFLNTYLFHTISELGIPNANSPLSVLMNIAFVFIGLALIFVDFTKFKDFIIKNKTIFFNIDINNRNRCHHCRFHSWGQSFNLRLSHSGCRNGDTWRKYSAGFDIKVNVRI